MNFNKHFALEGQHALLSASKYHWVNYSEERLVEYFLTVSAAQRGSELHDLAYRLIKNGVKLTVSKKTLNLYVNDAIGYRMTPEQVLFYSENAFGTVDAISFRKNVLRISDLKNGVSPTKVTQLEIYAAFFCLEYGFKPHELERIELRIYQNDEVREYIADPEEILRIMNVTIAWDRRIKALREEAGQ